MQSAIIKDYNPIELESSIISNYSTWYLANDTKRTISIVKDSNLIELQSIISNYTKWYLAHDTERTISIEIRPPLIMVVCGSIVLSVLQCLYSINYIRGIFLHDRLVTFTLVSILKLRIVSIPTAL